MRFHAVIGGMDLDSASALSSAAGSPKLMEDPPPLQQPQQMSNHQQQHHQQQSTQFSGHLMLMDLDSNSSGCNLLTPTPPGSPGSNRRPVSRGRAAQAVVQQLSQGPASVPPQQQQQQQLQAEQQQVSPPKLAPTTFTPPSIYADRADRTLFFARVSSAATTEEVSAAFAACGDVAEVNLFRAWPTAKASKGCGLVVMATKDGADRAIATLDKQRTWEGADGPMVVERCDPSRLGVKAANAAASKAMRAASAATTAMRRGGGGGAAAPMPAAGTRSGPIAASAALHSGPLPPALAAPQGTPLLAHQHQQAGAQGQQPLLFVPTFNDNPAGRGFSAPLLRYIAQDPLSSQLPPQLSAPQLPPSDRALSGPLAAVGAAGGPYRSYDDAAAPSAFDVTDSLCSALLGMRMQGGQVPAASGPLQFLPLEILPLSAQGSADLPSGPIPLLPQDALSPQHAAAWARARGAQMPAAPQGGSLASCRGQLYEEMVAVERERRAAEATASLLQQQQQQLELLLLQQQELEQQQLMINSAGSNSSAGGNGPQVVYQQLPPPQLQPDFGAAQQRAHQQMAIPITPADLGVVSAHAPTLALLSGATLSVDAGAAADAALGAQRQLWLIVTGSPPQLQSASTLLTRLLGTSSM